jgi:hypothetical protein
MAFGSQEWQVLMPMSLQMLAGGARNCSADVRHRCICSSRAPHCVLHWAEFIVRVWRKILWCAKTANCGCAITFCGYRRGCSWPSNRHDGGLLGSILALAAKGELPHFQAGLILEVVTIDAWYWDNSFVKRSLKSRKWKKVWRNKPGRTWIEVNNEVHTFVVDDQDHPQMIEIHAELQRL